MKHCIRKTINHLINKKNNTIIKIFCLKIYFQVIDY